MRITFIISENKLYPQDLLDFRRKFFADVIVDGDNKAIKVSLHKDFESEFKNHLITLGISDYIIVDGDNKVIKVPKILNLNLRDI